MVSGMISCQRNGSDSAVRLYGAPRRTTRRRFSPNFTRHGARRAATHGRLNAERGTLVGEMFRSAVCRRAKTGEASFVAAAPHSESCHNQRIAACGPTCVRMHLPYRHTDPATGVPGRICIPRFCLAAWAWLSILSVARPTSCGEGPAWRHINGGPTHDQSAAHPFRMRASLMPLPLCLKGSRRMHQIRGRQHAGRDRES